MLSGNATVFGIDPFSESSTPVHPIGTKGMTPDGRIFRYAKNGAVALTTGKLTIAADLVTNHEDRAFATAGAVGDKTVSISIGATAITANQYDEGYLVIIDDTGEGHVHQIVSHGTTSGSANVSFTISPGLEEATTTSTTVSLMRNRWSGVLISDGSQSDVAAGVTPIAVTAGYYFWAQTGGMASILTDTGAQAVQGQPITIGGTSSGGVTIHDAATETYLGMAPVGVTPTSGEHNPYWLEIDR